MMKTKKSKVKEKEKKKNRNDATRIYVIRVQTGTRGVHGSQRRRVEGREGKKRLLNSSVYLYKYIYIYIIYTHLI